MAMLQESECRRQRRITCSLSVQLHAPSEDVLLFTYATNVSETGAFVRANRLLPIGTKVHVSLQPESFGGRVKLEGLVVRVANGDSPRGMGLSFAPPTNDLKTELDHLLKRIDHGVPAADADAYAWHHRQESHQ
jgi:hypothetical protein